MKTLALGDVSEYKDKWRSMREWYEKREGKGKCSCMRSKAHFSGSMLFQVLLSTEGAGETVTAERTPTNAKPVRKITGEQNSWFWPTVLLCSGFQISQSLWMKSWTRVDSLSSLCWLANKSIKDVVNWRTLMSSSIYHILVTTIKSELTDPFTANATIKQFQPFVNQLSISYIL